MQLAAALEGTLRSLNNLLERLHHSYFMYLLPATNKFIPIEAYTLPPALILLALFILAANACLCLPSRLPPRPPSAPGSAGASARSGACGDSSEAIEAQADVETYPRQVMQQITIRGGWAAVMQSCSKVAVVHAAAAAVGLAVHVGATHAAGGTPADAAACGKCCRGDACTNSFMIMQPSPHRCIDSRHYVYALAPLHWHRSQVSRFHSLLETAAARSSVATAVCDTVKCRCSSIDSHAA